MFYNYIIINLYYNEKKVAKKKKAIIIKSYKQIISKTVSPSGKAMDCKSFILQFESGHRLLRGRGGMVDTTDLKSVDFNGREGSSPSVPNYTLYIF